MSSWECVHTMILIIFVGIASIMIFDDFNDYDPKSMSMVMMLVREMVQDLKISLRGVNGTHISFFRQILELSSLLSIHDYVFLCSWLFEDGYQGSQTWSSLWAFDLFSADQRLLQIHKTEIDPFKYVSSWSLLHDSDDDEDDHFGRIDARRRLHLLLVTPDMTSLWLLHTPWPMAGRPIPMPLKRD